jgi:uncharacterized lipoprotein NlpE involved in copper resistance
MKPKSMIVAIVLILSFMGCNAQNEKNEANFPELKGPYLGQKPPGITPEIFAPGIINPDLHGCPVFSKNGSEAYWNVMGSKHISGSFIKDGKWTKPKELDFFRKLEDSGEPCLSIDGNTLFVVSRTAIEEGLPEKLNIWFLNKIKKTNRWGKPQPLSKIVNSIELQWQISVAENGNLYFHSRTSGGGDIFIAEFKNGSYSEPYVLGANVNTELYEVTPYISPDESYIIFSRLKLGSPIKSGLFISFKGINGTWTKAISLDILNKDNSHQLCPNLSPDGKYLFFKQGTGSNRDIYWVDAKIIKDKRFKIK